MLRKKSKRIPGSLGTGDIFCLTATILLFFNMKIIIYYEYKEIGKSMNEKRKRRIKNSCFILGVLAMTTCLVFILGKITERKNSVEKYKEFFDEAETYDVLFLGSSHMLDGVIPLELWDDYGITSYNMGNKSLSIPTSYWIMMNSFDYMTPKVVVIDGYLLGAKTKINQDNYSSVHNSLDVFPLSRTKVEAVKDLLNDPVADELIASGDMKVREGRDPMGLLWDFSVYHNRWNSLTKNDLFPEYDSLKGANLKTGVYSHELSNIDETWEGDSVAVEYLEKIAEECEARDIEVVYIYIPGRDGSQDKANRIEAEAEKMGVKAIDFYDVEVTNSHVDYADESGHMNISGAKKITRYLGEFLTQYYDLLDHRAEENYSKWDDDFEEYLQYKINLIKTEEIANQYLMMLNDKDLTCKIICNQEFYDENAELIENINYFGAASIEIINSKDKAYVEVYSEKNMIERVAIIGNSILREEE